MTFGEKLKDARKGVGYSQEELAEKLAVSGCSYGRIYGKQSISKEDYGKEI